MNYFQRLLEEIAADHGTTADEVLRDMQLAIDKAYDDHPADAQPLWDAMTFEGERPTAEEFVLQIAALLALGQDGHLEPVPLGRNEKLI